MENTSIRNYCLFFSFYKYIKKKTNYKELRNKQSKQEHEKFGTFV